MNEARVQEFPFRWVPVGLALGLVFWLCVLMFLGSRMGQKETDLTSVTTGEEARRKVESESTAIPASADNFYHWDQGFLSDHTTYWSFTCGSIGDCRLAALSVHSRPTLKEWTLPEYDFIRLGPAHFSKSPAPTQWDLDQIRTGVAALSIDYSKHVSELNYTAIDYDTLRVYRLRWYGSSLTTELDRIGYEPEQDDFEQDDFE